MAAQLLSYKPVKLTMRSGASETKANQMTAPVKTVSPPPEIIANSKCVNGDSNKLFAACVECRYQMCRRCYDGGVGKCIMCNLNAMEF